jgi:hypothetical protein
VYRHREHGWEYVPIHPFGDEAALLGRLKLTPLDCIAADAWWGVDGEATLLEAWVARLSKRPPGLYAKAPRYREQSVGLEAVFDAEFVTREGFERAMTSFAKAGFPRDPRFGLRWGEHWLAVSFVPPVLHPATPTLPKSDTA